MVVRNLSTLITQIQGRRTISRAQRDVTLLGKELSTGLKADTARSLGMRTAQSLNLRNMMQQNEEFLLGNKLLDNKLDVLAGQIGDIREAAQSMLNLTIGNTEYKTTTAKALQLESKSKLEEVIRRLNTNYNGDFLFAGIDSQTKPVANIGEVDPITGLSPLQAMQNAIGGSITSPIDATNKISEIDDMFNSTHPTDPNMNFEGTFFKGTPESDGRRMTARPDDTTVIDWGIQANDQPMRDVLKGLYMLSSIDSYQINDEDAYKAWVKEASNALNSGIEGIIQAETRLGGQQQQVVQIIEINEDKNVVLNNRIHSLEYVDLYEAQTRMAALETQMQATFSTTARLSRLTILDWLR